ncbi:MAG: site-specific integrase [Parvularcula sp.]|jgi:integrase|nr:site-specific integrase [Parvularcula sp.]
MNARSLNEVADDALADIGFDPKKRRRPKGRQRMTEWLSDEPGFGLRHYPNGRSVYIVQARMGGRNRTVTIGSAVVLTKAQAAKVARLVLAHARVGGDPASTKQRVKGAPMFQDFVEEFWDKWSGRWAAKTLSVNTYYRRTYLDGCFPGLGVDEIDEGHVTEWFARLNDNAPPGAANMVLTMLNLMLNKAEDWGYRLDHTNPCRAVRRNKPKRFERYLSKQKLHRLGAVLATWRQSEDVIQRLTASATTLLLLTGCRRGEILGLHWGDIQGRRIKLRHAKTGPRTVWLGAEAQEIFQELPRHQGIEWVFWNPRTRKPITDYNAQWRLVQAQADISGVRLHDLRHTFASHAAMNQEALPMIGKLLGHRHIQSTSRYAHLDDGHIFEAAETVGAAVERTMSLDRLCS